MVNFRSPSCSAEPVRFFACVFLAAQPARAALPFAIATVEYQRSG